MHPSPEGQTVNSGLYLYSFAPSSGVGFYLTPESVYKFDLVTNESTLLEGAALGAQRAEFDQIAAEAYFPTYDELLSFTRAEYLRDKKNTLYALLLTEDLGEELNVKTLRILNDPEFSDIGFSERIIPVFQEIAVRKRVSSITLLAAGLNLRYVQDCLVNELQDLTFPAILEILDDFDLRVRYEERPSIFDRALGLLADYVLVARRIPEYALESIMGFCAAAERNITSLGVQGMSALNQVLDRFQEKSPAVNYALALSVSPERAGLISETFTQALLRSDVESIVGLTSRLGETIPPIDEGLAAAGQAILDSGVRWEEVYNPYFPYIDAITFDESGESRQEIVRAVSREVVSRYAGHTAFGYTHSKIQFTVSFISSASIFEEVKETPEPLTGGVSFWIAYYANPSLALERLGNFRSGYYWPYRLDDFIYYMGRRLEYSAMSAVEICSIYHNFNLVPILLTTPEEVSALRFREVTLRAAPYLLRLNEMWGESSTATNLTSPAGLLLSNFFALAVRQGDVELAVRLFEVLHRAVEREELRLSPFLRFII